MMNVSTFLFMPSIDYSFEHLLQSCYVICSKSLQTTSQMADSSHAEFHSLNCFKKILD